METAPLRNFATWARTALIREVAARVAAVLAPGSSERVEQAKAVAALERAVAAAGGGDKGRAAVAEKVAYTWFNRIVALRFMDANGYTGIGIVSPQAGIEVGQPELLSVAKRGVIDTEVASQSTRTAVAGLLDGTRASGDPQGEAYALLLADYCRYWNKAMPFMFEREGDYTELLIPANLLADDSVLNRAVTVLTEDVCKDVEVIGWLYQFYISERKDEVFAGFKKNKKAGADEIPAATQLFTPHWIVRYLVENSLGRLWMLNRPDSGLVKQMDYYVAPADDQTDFLKITKPEELKVIDPACGSGHMLTYAFDLLYAIYEEEGYGPSEIPGLILANNLYGTEIDPRAGALAAFALTMKARAKQRTFFTKQVEPNICVIEPISFGPEELDFLVTRGGDRHEEFAFWNQFADADTFGSLIQPDPDVTARLSRHLETLEDGGDILKADTVEWAKRVVVQAAYLGPRYTVLVANPPYMGGGNMGALLADFARRSFPGSKNDLFSMFIERSFSLLTPFGYSAMVTMESWMFLKSFKDLRESIVQTRTIENLLHMPYLGKGSTSMGINFGTVAAVVCNAHLRGVEAFFQCVRYFETDNNGVPLEFPVRNERTASLDAERFASIPGMPIAYWFPDQLLKVFEASPTVSSVARAAKGLVTADNASFVREWWEVSRARILFGAASREAAAASSCRWFPYAKGGEFRRWAGNLEAVVNWENDGHAIQTTLTADGSRVRATNFNLDRIFRPGIAWTVVTSGALSFRQVGQGFLFADAAGICQGADDEYLLALLNSNAATQVLHGLNPTLNLQPGNLESVPVPDDGDRDEIRALARRAVEISTLDWDAHERSWAFDRSPLLGRSDRLADSVAHLQQEWDELTGELRRIEESNNKHFGGLFGLSTAPTDADTTSLSLNPDFAYAGLAEAHRPSAMTRELIRELLSYAVGCMFGRYSLDAPGLILADQGATLQDYLAKIPSPSFTPDADNVIPIIDGDWFEDDIVERFRQFLRTAFGEQHFEENLRFVTESLGVKTLRDYFVKSFYKDHVQRYKKRPIYWLFSSPRGSFSALVYVHRYQPTTVSTVLNEYLREFQAKLKAGLEHAERTNNAKEADRLRTILLELDAYEHDVLYPLASQNVAIDLDDGVKANYPRLGTALRKIVGLEATE
jgi:hypothetical protein